MYYRCTSCSAAIKCGPAQKPKMCKCKSMRFDRAERARHITTAEVYRSGKGELFTLANNKFTPYN